MTKANPSQVKRPCWSRFLVTAKLLLVSRVFDKLLAGAWQEHIR